VDPIKPIFDSIFLETFLIDNTIVLTVDVLMVGVFGVVSIKPIFDSIYLCNNLFYRQHNCLQNFYNFTINVLTLDVFIVDVFIVDVFIVGIFGVGPISPCLIASI
jgi:hypothetical protein